MLLHELNTPKAPYFVQLFHYHCSQAKENIVRKPAAPGWGRYRMLMMGARESLYSTATNMLLLPNLFKSYSGLGTVWQDCPKIR